MKCKQLELQFCAIEVMKMINKLKFYWQKNTYPYRNLAIEEFLTTHVQDGELIVYLWQNANTVVIGRNQNAWQECNVAKLTQDDGYIVRRLSGGGAVYHDMGNLNFTFCVKKADYNVAKQLDIILTAVNLLGIHAEKTGRNDITIEGKKFSGNAFYQTGDCCYHHGTILLDVDTNKMMKYLNVDAAKLQSKGVTSVKSRVTNIKNYYPQITVDLMVEKIKEAAQQVYNCTAQIINEQDIDTDEIDKLEAKFSNWQWILGRKIKFTHQIKQRFVWGNIDLHLIVNGGKIQECEIYSDALDQDFILQLKQNLVGCVYDIEAITAKIEQIQIDTSIKKDLIDLIKANLGGGTHEI